MQQTSSAPWGPLPVHPWDTCLRLAVQGLVAGSMGIAALIATPEGQIVASARNQLYDDEATPNALRNNAVAHAEVNAIAALPQSLRRDKSLVMYTTVEPCPMCLGAIVMSPIRTLHVASLDPWAGALGLLARDAYMGGKRISVTRPGEKVERVFATSHLLGLFPRVAEPHPVFQRLREVYPACYERARSLSRDAAVQTAIRERDTRALEALLLREA